MAGASSDEEAIWLAVPVALTNFVFTFIGLMVVERMGRRKLLLVSLAGVIFSLLLLSVTFFLELKMTPDVVLHERNITAHSCSQKYQRCYSCVEDNNCGFCFTKRHDDIINGTCLPSARNSHTGHSSDGMCKGDNTSYTWFYDHCPFPYSWLAVFGLVLYLAWFAPGMGPMPWTVNSEIYPQWARSFGNSSSATTNWVFNLLVSMTFLDLTKWLTKCGAFGLYTGIAFVGWLFIYSFVPETKGKSLEEVTRLFDEEGSNTPLRRPINDDDLRNGSPVN